MTNETISQTVIYACQEDEGKLVESFGIAFGVLTLLGSVIAYFLQQERERKDAIEAKIKEDNDLDRALALERVRQQLSVFIGPMHRAFKIQYAMHAQYIKESGHGYGNVAEILEKKGQLYWTTLFSDDFLQPFIENPYSFEAIKYRNFIKRRLKPVYERTRELVMNHMADLADMPTQEEWLERWAEADVRSPYNGSLNINVIFDTFVVSTYELDDIIESWEEEDFRRMQPTTRVAYIICNDLVDYLYEKAKEKEAKYNKHVTIHKNNRQFEENGKLKKEILEWYEKNLYKVTNAGSRLTRRMSMRAPRAPPVATSMPAVDEEESIDDFKIARNIIRGSGE